MAILIMYSSPLNNVGLNCMGPLCRFFQLTCTVQTHVVHRGQLVAGKLHMQEDPFKLYTDFLWGSRIPNPALFKGQLYIYSPGTQTHAN